MRPLDRRTVLRLSGLAAVAGAGVRPVAAEPIDGKGNDVCPCFFDIDEVVREDGGVRVSGPCAVADPPQPVTVHVRVRDDRGARAVGDGSFSCTASEPEGERDTFTVVAPIRGDDRFGEGEVHVDATVHINPEDAPAVSGRWSWTGPLG